MAKAMTNDDEYPVQMEPLMRVKKFLLIMAYITGFQCTEPDWKFNILSLITCVNMVKSTLLIIYSLLKGGDIFEKIETICCFGVSAPVSVEIIQSKIMFYIFISTEYI